MNLINNLAPVIGIPHILLVNIRNIEGKGKIVPEAIETFSGTIIKLILENNFSCPLSYPLFCLLTFSSLIIKSIIFLFTFWCKLLWWDISSEMYEHIFRNSANDPYIDPFRQKTVHLLKAWKSMCIVIP